MQQECWLILLWWLRVTSVLLPITLQHVHHAEDHCMSLHTCVCHKNRAIHKKYLPLIRLFWRFPKIFQSHFSIRWKLRNVIRNIPEIFNRLLQRPHILSGQYYYVPFMQKKHAIRLQIKKKKQKKKNNNKRKNILSVSIIKGWGVWNSKTVRNRKKSL